MRYILIVFLVVLFLVSCQMIDVESEIENATTSLESGDLDSAEQSFSRVLQANPNNPTANAGMAIVKFIRGFFEAYSIYEDMSQEMEDEIDTLKRTVLKGLLKNVIPNFKPLSEEEFDLSEILQEISDFQDEVEELIPVYEDAYSYADRALSGDFEQIRIYPNRLDVDGDGKIEPNTPLKFRTNYGRVFTVEDFYRCTVPELSDGEIVFIDESGGDAWFDLDKMVSGGCGEPSFDENDYVEVDRGEMLFIKAYSAMLLSYMNAIVTYKFEIPEYTVNVINRAINQSDQNILIEFLDADSNGTIANAEIQSKFEGFLEFRDGIERLRNVLIYAKNSIESFIDLDDEIRSDDEDMHNITSPFYFEDGILSDDEKAELERWTDYLTDTPIPYYETNFATINLFVLKDHPERFQDLKDFLPDWNYNTKCYSFPDPSFGGLVESEWDGTGCGY